VYASALMAFLHHLAAFGLVGALAAELVLFKPPLTLTQARRIQGADKLFGATAAVLLVVGLLRVAHFEKGAGYYFANGFFLAKFALFIVAGLISIYPTWVFISWNQALKRNELPAIAPHTVTRIRMCMMLELTAILGILLCAPFMARGIGLLH
jgi:putative membrane protein